MRVLITVIAVKTHLYNAVPLAWALRAAGHDVRVAGQPDLADAITAAGLTAVPVGEELAMGRSSSGPRGQTFRAHGGGMLPPDELTWEHALGAFTVACPVEYEFFADQTVLDDLVGYARQWQPDLVIWDALTFSGAIAAHASGAAHARLLFGIDYVTRMYDGFVRLRDQQPAERREDPVAEWLAGRLARYGCESHPGLDRELMTGQACIDPTPSWMQTPLDLPWLPMRFVPYNGGEAAPDWVYERPDRPRVCLSLGMSGRDLFGGDQVSVVELVTALATLDVEVVATLTAGQLDGARLPDNVRVVDFVPLNDLLPTCAAIVQHGGFGTLGNVLTHGVPSLTVPAPWWDERDLGRHLHERGAGLLLEPERITPAALTDAVRELLTDPRHRENAEDVRREILATPSPAAVTSALEQLAG
ncbi:glycosyl transferase family 28 [Micromonospora arborensis]|uniref:Glycosyl transferase family 28 n=1 Tax=Micromonospora arborensis TaxID=2116518 RepID=A0A318NAM8_9ACTN|nr:activator-dependent family glycosyltransferase [Micromonospora arborensis]PYC63452.1 glycosyl transferase family 28 [Micromonospora arborensis]